MYERCERRYSEDIANVPMPTSAKGIGSESGAIAIIRLSGSRCRARGEAKHPGLAACDKQPALGEFYVEIEKLQ